MITPGKFGTHVPLCMSWVL